MADTAVKIPFAEAAAPGTPAANKVVIYAKSDGLMYSKDDAGTETVMSGGGSTDLDAIITASAGEDIADALSGAAAPDAGNVFATMADIGGGGLTQAYIGYNTVGGSYEGMTDNKVYTKKVTISTACLLTDICAYVQNDSGAPDDMVTNLSGVVYADNAGTPSTIIAYLKNAATSLLMDSTSGGGGDGVSRWLSVAMGIWLPAADYWIGVSCMPNNSVSTRIAYDGSGSDRTYTSGGSFFADWGFYTPTTTSNKYSIRGNTIS